MKRQQWMRSATFDATKAAALAAAGYGVWRLWTAISAKRSAPSPQTATDGAIVGAKILILSTDGFEESELVETRRLLADEGATCVVAAPARGTIQGVRHKQPGARVVVDRSLSEVAAEDFDALLLPGGVANADALRAEPIAVALTQRFSALGKPIAAICHAPWLLVEAGILDHCRVTSWPSLKTDLVNAGAQWRDQAVVVDGNLITSRKPQDIPAFAAQLVAAVQSRTKTNKETRDGGYETAVWKKGERQSRTGDA